MQQEQCYGVIPFRISESGKEVFLVKHTAGEYWGFSKGHAEQGESPQKTAERELFEETHLEVERYLSDELQQECYQFEREGVAIQKSVGYFLATVKGEPKVERGEVLEARWVSCDEAPFLLTFSGTQAIFFRAMQILTQS